MDSKTGRLLSGRSPGYWGKNPYARIIAEGTIDKVTRWNIDKIMTMGLPFAVWREVPDTMAGVNVCSCVKDTSRQADVPCLSCYGTGKIPGFLKFGTKNYWLSSIDESWALTNMEVDKVNRPFRLQLISGQTTGTAISGPITIDLSNKLGVWQYNIDGFTRDGGANSSVIAEFSVDNMVTWLPMSQLETGSPFNSVRFRVTMQRSSVAVKSPMFEMIRLRFQNIRDIRQELSEPVIRVLSTWDKTSEHRTQYGSKIENNGKRFWTLPLNFFDSSIDRESYESRLADDCIIEVRYGGNIGTRFALNEFDYSDTFSQFTRQEFSLRQFVGEPNKLYGEYAYRVW